jgi:hypothetical protein
VDDCSTTGCPTEGFGPTTISHHQHDAGSSSGVVGEDEANAARLLKDAAPGMSVRPAALLSALRALEAPDVHLVLPGTAAGPGPPSPSPADASPAAAQHIRGSALALGCIPAPPYLSPPGVGGQPPDDSECDGAGGEPRPASASHPFNTAATASTSALAGGSLAEHELRVSVGGAPPRLQQRRRRPPQRRRQQAYVAELVAAMTPDQLCGTLLGLAVWRQPPGQRLMAAVLRRVAQVGRCVWVLLWAVLLPCAAL